MKYEFDNDGVVVIIGSGAGGGTLANELCQKGIDVVLLEAFHQTSAPGTLRALTILERAPDGAWTYYSLSGATAAANPLAGGHDASYLNRALALFAHLAAIDPCDPAIRAD
jgi:choline dehydrogenase-like flavoprotein